MVHSEMCANWGYEKLHKAIEGQAHDEMHHAGMADAGSASLRACRGAESSCQARGDRTIKRTNWALYALTTERLA